MSQRTKGNYAGGGESFRPKSAGNKEATLLLRGAQTIKCSGIRGKGNSGFARGRIRLDNCGIRIGPMDEIRTLFGMDVLT